MPLPHSAATVLRRIAGAVTALALAASLAACSEPAREPGPLDGAAIGGEFALTGKDGETVRWSDFAGQWRIVYFGYTFCPDVCPLDVAAIGQGLRAFEKVSPELGSKVVPIFITVDPVRDTPAVVGEFAAAFHPRMVGLTGSEDAIAAAAKAFSVYHAKGEKSEGGGYLVDHSRAAILFDPDGNPVALIPADEGGQAVERELAQWVR